MESANWLYTGEDNSSGDDEGLTFESILDHFAVADTGIAFQLKGNVLEFKNAAEMVLEPKGKLTFACDWAYDEESFEIGLLKMSPMIGKTSISPSECDIRD